MDLSSSPYIISTNNPYNSFPHSLLSTREFRFWILSLDKVPLKEPFGHEMFDAKAMPPCGGGCFGPLMRDIPLKDPHPVMVVG